MNRARARILLVGLLPGLLGAADVPYAGDPWIEVTTSNFRLISNAEESAALHQTVRSLMRESDVTGPSNGDRRPWGLDSLPFVIDPNEWPLLEAGLVQRATLLNKIVADFYGAGTLLRGKLPTALAFANPDYLLASCGASAPESAYLTLLAFDLGRSPDGTWRVLSNRTEAPSGLGYALENRMTMSRFEER